MSADPREEIIAVCRELSLRGLTTATGGNISVRLPDGSCWVTPSRMHKGRVTKVDLVRVGKDGRVVEGSLTPSSEIKMHLALYAALPEAGAVVHAHPPAATGFAMAEQSLDASSSSEALAILGAEVPLLSYIHPGTSEFAEMVAVAVRADRPAYLLAHHGVLTWGRTLWEAFDALDTCEGTARSLLAAQVLGGAISLSPEEIILLMSHALR